MGEIQRLHQREKSTQEFLERIQSENIEQEDHIALLKTQVKSFQRSNDELEAGKRLQDKKVFDLEQNFRQISTALAAEKNQNNSTQDVILELEACNKRQDDQIDKLENKISELNLKLETATAAQKSEKEDLEKQRESLKERNVDLSTSIWSFTLISKTLR